MNGDKEPQPVLLGCIQFLFELIPWALGRAFVDANFSSDQRKAAAALATRVFGKVKNCLSVHGFEPEISCSRRQKSNQNDQLCI